jgi:hypothetical protein
LGRSHPEGWRSAGVPAAQDQGVARQATARCSLRSRLFNRREAVYIVVLPVEPAAAAETEIRAPGSH